MVPVLVEILSHNWEKKCFSLINAMCFLRALTKTQLTEIYFANRYIFLSKNVQQCEHLLLFSSSVDLKVGSRDPLRLLAF